MNAVHTFRGDTGVDLDIWVDHGRVALSITEDDGLSFARPPVVYLSEAEMDRLRTELVLDSRNR